MTDMRTCRIKGCENEHPRTFFSCGDHWRQLPSDLRRAIWRTYKGGDGILDAEYLQACENAEAFLEERESKDMSALFT